MVRQRSSSELSFRRPFTSHPFFENNQLIASSSLGGFNTESVRGVGHPEGRHYYSGNRRGPKFGFSTNESIAIELQEMPKHGHYHNNKQASVSDQKKSPFSWDRVRGAVQFGRSMSGVGSRERATTEPEPRMSHTLHNLPFPLLPLKEAARIQAHRRASGLEDQTESGSCVAYHPMATRIRQSSAAVPSPSLPMPIPRGPSPYTPLNPQTGHILAPERGKRLPPPSCPLHTDIFSKFTTAIPTTTIAFLSSSTRASSIWHPMVLVSTALVGNPASTRATLTAPV